MITDPVLRCWENITKEWEGADGSVSWDKAGGATKWGVATNFFDDDMKKRVGKEKVEDLTEEDAVDIFRLFYFERLRLNFLNTPGIEDLLFDTSINPGPSFVMQEVRKILQVNVSSGPLRDWEIVLLQEQSYEAKERMIMEVTHDKVDYRLNQVRVGIRPSKYLQGWSNRYNALAAFARKNLVGTLVT